MTAGTTAAATSKRKPVRAPRSAELYLDHAATTPVSGEVVEAMVEHYRTEFGNPSSVHRAGQRARRALEVARERVAAAVGARPREVVFTSGATEANDHAIFVTAARSRGGLVVSATEHPSVLEAARRLAGEGRDVAFVAPRADGSVPLDAVRAELERQAAGEGTALVAVMYVNNETGVLTEPRSVADLAHEYGAMYLLDAVQAFGFERLDLAATGADFVTLSAHKVSGPKGAGALVLRPGLELPPLLAGGEQERGMRPGTQALPAIIGFGVAAELAVARYDAVRAHVGRLRDRFEARALALPGVALNGAGAERGVKHSNVSVEGANGETLLMLLDEAGLQASSGSACSAGSLSPSHVLLAMGLSPRAAKASVRFSFGVTLTEDDVDDAAGRFAEVTARLGEPAAVG